MKLTCITPRIPVALVSASLLGGAFGVLAAPIAEDSFDGYAPGTGGSLIGQNGGTGWAGPWAAGAGNVADVVDTSADPLMFTPAGGSPIVGGPRAVLLTGTANQPTASRALPASLPDAIYAAYLMRISAGSWTDTDTYSVHLSSAPGSTASLNFGVRGPRIFMVRTGTGAPVPEAIVDSPTDVGVTTYLVARFSKLDGSGAPSATYDRIELWVNPAVDDNVNAPTGHGRLQLATGTGLPTLTHAFVRIAALEAADAVQVDQLIIGASWSDVINPATAPFITGLAPASGTLFWPAANGISFAANSTDPIDPTGISLVLNDVDVSSQLNISGNPLSRLVTYNGLGTNLQYRAQITVSNVTGSSTTAVSFDTFSETDAVVIEAEDYNYDIEGDCDRIWGAFYGFSGGGGFQDNPPPSGYDLTTGALVGGVQSDLSRLGYVDAVGLPEVDFHDASTNILDAAATVFRYCDTVGTRVAQDQRREKYLDSNLPEYEVFQMSIGDWMNYTRGFSPSAYKAYLRVASTAAGRVQLGRVAGDPTTTNQTEAPAGVFLIPDTGGTNNYTYVPLTDASGQVEVTVTLGSPGTVRLTGLDVSGNLFVNFLVLVPSGVSLVPPTVAIDTPTNGSVFPSGASIPVEISAADDGSVTEVKVTARTFNSTNVIATLTGEPYSFNWHNPPDGIYTLAATVTDNDGLQGISISARITVGTPPPPTLFVVGGFPLNAGDLSVQDRLESLGLQLLIKLATDVVPEDGNGKQLIVVSSTVLSGDLGTRLTDAPAPVIQWEQALADEFRFSNAGGNLGDQRAVVITPEGAAHPLGAGLPEGTNLVRTTAIAFHLASDNNLAPGAVVIARAANDTNTGPVIVGIDTGGLLNNGAPAPARRVHMFWGDEGLTGVTGAGLALFDAAVNWSLGRQATPPSLEITRSGDTLIISWPASATSAVLEETADVANPAGWTTSNRIVDTVGGQKSVTITAPTGALFFRLRSD